MVKKDKHEAWLKKLKLKEQVIHMGSFDFDVAVVVGPHESLDEYIAFKYDEPGFTLQDDYEPRGKFLHCAGYVPIIWIPKKPETAGEYATLAHECLHAAKHVMRWACIPFSDDTEEVETHIMGHLITEILNGRRS